MARFATERYSTHGVSPYSHLTNATLNKKRINWSSDFKWKLSELLNELQHRYGRTYESLFQQIEDVVVIALALLQPSMKNDSSLQPSSNYFELFGFDILFDKNFHAWLLEINTFPSLGYDEDVDFNVKAPLVAQALSIVGIPDYPFDELAKNHQLQKEILMTSSRQFELEDERNKLSGYGFVRLFPSKLTDHLQPLLYKQNPPPIENISSDDNFSVRQYSELVVHYLKHLFIKLCTKHLSQKEIDKLSGFLVAQGYKYRKTMDNLINDLQMLIQRIETRFGLDEDKNTLVPKSIHEKFQSNDKIFIQKVSSACPEMVVKHFDSLF